MNQKNREPGHYWVKSRGEWCIGYWCDVKTSWLFHYDDWGYPDDNFDEIDERRIVREEPTE